MYPTSGSMFLFWKKYDFIIVQGRKSFEDIEMNDILVFGRSSDHNKIIVHIVSIIDDDSKTIRMQRNANNHQFSEYIFQLQKKNA